MPLDFVTKLSNLQQTRKTDLGLIMSPHLSRMPLPMQRYDDPFLPFGKAIIDATFDLICAYMFNLASYLMLGAAGIIALERTIAYVGSDVITILHGPFFGSDYAGLLNENVFAVDAVTIVECKDALSYQLHPAHKAFVIRTGYPQFNYESFGIYWCDINQLTLSDPVGQTLRMRLAGDSVLFAGHGDNFALKTRTALEAIR